MIVKKNQGWHAMSTKGLALAFVASSEVQFDQLLQARIFAHRKLLFHRAELRRGNHPPAFVQECQLDELFQTGQHYTCGLESLPRFTIKRPRKYQLHLVGDIIG